MKSNLIEIIIRPKALMAIINNDINTLYNELKNSPPDQSEDQDEY